MLKLFSLILSAAFVAGCAIIFFETHSLISGVMVLVSALISPIGDIA